MLIGAIRSVLPELQAEAEGMMVESLRIDRVLGTTTLDDASVVPLLMDPPPYEGRGKINSYQPYETERDASGSLAVTQRYTVHIPNGVIGVKIGDYVTITAGEHAGRVLRVAGTHEKTFQTAQRLLCDEHTGGLHV